MAKRMRADESGLLSAPPGTYQTNGTHQRERRYGDRARPDGGEPMEHQTVTHPFLVAALATFALAGGSVNGVLAETPIMDSQLHAGFVTEDTEPGVRRVVNDGIRDIEIPDTGTPNSWLSVGADGQVWVVGESAEPGESIGYRVGHEDEIDWGALDITPWTLEVAPDGTLWGARWSGARGGDLDVVSSLSAGRWVDRMALDERDYVLAFGVTPDGEAWATVSDQSTCPDDSAGPGCVGYSVAVSGASGSQLADGWQEVFGGELAPHAPVVDFDGNVWLAGSQELKQGSRIDALLKFDGSRWSVLEVPADAAPAAMGRSFDVALDGTVWLATSQRADGHHDGLARLDERGWTIFDSTDGVQPWGGQFWFATDYLRVAPDGSAWVNAADTAGGCDGVARFDASTWTPYLQGYCIDDFDIAPDGTAWVLASAGYGGPIHAYLIEPETRTSLE